MSIPAVLGVDIGTSSTKAVLVNTDGEIIRSATLEHEVQRPASGQVEMSGSVWWDEFVHLTSELLEPGDVSVEAIGVSGMGPCVLLTDEKAEPVRPAILYGVDTRAAQQIFSLNKQLGESNILHRCGSVLTSQSAGPKIAWVAEHEPEAFSAATRFLMPASYLALKLTGAYVLDHHSASQCTPLYDSEILDWYQPWADLAAPGLELPELRWPNEQAGVVTKEAAVELTGIDAGTPVITGTIDAWSEALSVDAQNPGDLMLMYGTTMFLIATTASRSMSETLWGTVGALKGTFNYAGGMATSGAITSWLRRLTGSPSFDVLIAEAETSGAGARGLLMLPYFAGERTPIQDPRARGVIIGLTLDHTRGDLYRAALEATALGVRHNVEELNKAGVTLGRVVAVGGGAQGDLWPQIVCDATGLDQVIPTLTVGASYGAARLAAGHAPSFFPSSGEGTKHWNPPARTLVPNPENHRIYNQLYESYRELYPATVEIAHCLAAIQGGPGAASGDAAHSEEKESRTDS